MAHACTRKDNFPDTLKVVQRFGSAQELVIGVVLHILSLYVGNMIISTGALVSSELSLHRNLSRVFEVHVMARCVLVCNLMTLHVSLGSILMQRNAGVNSVAAIRFPEARKNSHNPAKRATHSQAPNHGTDP